MSASLLFEQPHRGDVWRLEVTTYNGGSFANWRKWYRDGHTLKPTKQGLTFPLERLADREAAIADWRAAKTLSGHSRRS